MSRIAGMKGAMSEKENVENRKIARLRKWYKGLLAR